MTRFPIKFDAWYAALSSALLLSPSASYVEVDDAEIRVRMAWGFSARAPQSAIAAVASYQGITLSRGIHGFAGRWLVNGSGQGIVAIDFQPAQRGRVLGFPVRLHQLLVSVEDPAALIKLLTP